MWDWYKHFAILKNEDKAIALSTLKLYKYYI